MVHAVHHRSPCKTCRERKVKCDRSEPRCRRCKKAYLSCEGYEYAPVFVNFTTSLALPTLEQSNPAQPPGWHNVAVTRYVHRHPSQPKVGPWLSLGAYLEDFCMSHLTRNVFVGGPPGQQQEENSWVLTALRRDETLITHFAAFSVAKAYFARLYEQSWLLTNAARDYGKALQQLNSSLEHSASHAFARHLVAMFLLVFYELLVPTSHAGLYYHYSGIETLILSQSPSFYQNQPYLGYFMQARVLMISGALMRSKKTFLAKHEWKVVPWSGQTFKSLYHEIWDHLSDVAALLDYAESSTNAVGKKVAARNILLSRVDKKLVTIELWRRRWDGQNRGKIFYVEIDWSQTLLPRSDPTANVQKTLTYVDQQCARESMLYHTALLYLYWIQARCQTQLRSPPSSHVNLEEGSSSCGLHHVTWQIVLSVDYLMTSSRVKAGMSFLTLAADAMLKCYESADWLVHILIRMADVSGYGFFRQLLKYHTSHAVPAKKRIHLESSCGCINCPVQVLLGGDLDPD